MKKRTVFVMVLLLAVMFVIAGCTQESSQSYNSPQYQRAVGGGCGVAGKETADPQVSVAIDATSIF